MMTLRIVIAALAALLFCTGPARAALPVIEIEAAQRADAPDFFVIWLTGDGGWGKMEREVSRRLAAAGAPTVGISSFRYYARPRKSADTAAAIAALVPAYAARWGKTRFVLAGFSFGAASGPFVVRALAPAAREKLALAAFLSPGARANFWAGPWSWLGVGFGPKVAPAMAALAPTPVLCIGGAGVFGDVCPQTAPAGMVSVHLAGGHLLTNQYDEIARLILAESSRRK
ncbi:MAG TPA: AcvB/VirJ family lysyl-phosphatidylglycerol hydrolase [Caulobacterales bacterium]|nr:AcvB/VirJ family lysyl-phosphatidylglycerol hydrolase [Caulobacterales bacterium]